MAYEKRTLVDNETVIDKDLLDYMQDGIAVAHDEVSNLKNELYVPVSITESVGYFNAGGGISGAGAETQEAYTQRIPVNPDDIIHFSQKLSEHKQMWVAAGIYDETGVWISRVSLYTGNATEFSTDYTVPQGVSWVAFTYRTYGISTVTVEINALSTLYGKDEVDQKFEQTNNSVLDNVADTYGDIQLPAYENGVVYAENGSIKYANRDYTVRPVKGTGIRLKAGDVIKNSRPDSYELLGAYTTDGVTYVGIPSNMSPYVAPADGLYYISVNIIPKTGTASPDLINDFQFFRPTSRVTTGGVRSLFDMQKIKSINHRGYSAECPENTIPAFVMSAKNGFGIVETDLRCTSDGVPVLLHDASINRTARNADGSEISGTVNIADITYEQALTYDFGIWKGEKYAGTKIPTLAEAISVWKKLGVSAYVEIESPMTSAQLHDAVNIVKAAGYSDHITWISFDYKYLAVVSIVAPYDRLGLVTGNITASELAKMPIIKSKYNSVFVDADISKLTSESIGLAKEAGEAVEVWTADAESVLDGLDDYVSGVTSNYRNAQEYFKNKLVNGLPT
jgi:glycerophosphoryl diester phosphodiesterase